MFQGSVNCDLPSYKFSPCVKLRNSSNWGAVSADLGHIPFPKWTRPRSQNNFISLVSFQNFQNFFFRLWKLRFWSLRSVYKNKKIDILAALLFLGRAPEPEHHQTKSYVLYHYLWFLSKMKSFGTFYPDLSWKTCKTIKTDAFPPF